MSIITHYRTRIILALGILALTNLVYAEVITNTVRVTGTVTANAGTNLNTSTLATSANQTGGNQKTQIVDGSGNVIASTSNALNSYITNASLAGTAGTPNTKVISVQGISGGYALPVSGTFYQVTQPISIASAQVASGAFASGAISDGADVTLGAKADGKSTETGTNAVTVMQVLKEISYMEQTPASRAVTNTGTFATQATLAAETTKVIGTVNLASAQTLATLTSITNDVGIKDNGNSITVDNGGTFAVQESPLTAATNATSQLTLTSSGTAYQPTSPATAYLLVMCNNSDTDMKWGYATTTTTGILLPKSGGTVAMKMAASKAPFVNCASAGKVLDYTTTY